MRIQEIALLNNNCFHDPVAFRWDYLGSFAIFCALIVGIIIFQRERRRDSRRLQEMKEEADLKRENTNN